MGKLKTLPPRIKSLAPRIAEPSRAQREVERMKTRDRDREWRQWYGTARWQALRERVLARDLYKCQATGVLLIGKYPADDSPVVDHIKPHRGDPDLFWDETNLRAVSKAWHDSIKQSMERGGLPSYHPDWLRPSTIPLTIICGPPASGKTTWVRNHAQPDDIIIDLDMIASELAGVETHGWDRDTYLNPAIYRRNDLLGRLSRPNDWRAAWFIVGEPKATWRAWWQRKLQPQRIVVMETPEAECVRRVKSDPQRPYQGNTDAITRWWFEYDRRQGDERIVFGE